jgi:N-acetylglucosamine malate deacetylase 1
VPERKDLDLLAVVAHPDDAELICGGTLIRAADQGYRTGILDLTRGETGSFGTPEHRAREAGRAARIMGLAERLNAGLPDGALRNTNAARLAVAAHLRTLRPRTVILHGPGWRHPDHRAARSLGRDACFIAGLRNAPIEGEPFRPTKILYALAFLERAPRPSLAVDITDQMERKLEAVFAYESQFQGRNWGGEVPGAGARSFRDQILTHAAYCGSLVRRAYAEPFFTPETMLVSDVVTLEVASM